MQADRPCHIVQIAPEIAAGSGVAMVAYALEQEFLSAGCRVERFTLAEARGRPSSTGSRLAHAWDVIWFSTVGTRRARRFLADRPDAVSICHNDAMVGDIYVNHGLLRVAMRARGHATLRLLRNPLHLFTIARDRRRYRGQTHPAIVALSSTEARLLREEWGKIPAPISVIGNGVDLERFRPPTPNERNESRARMNVPRDAYLVAFIGNEFDRKGLPQLIDAIPAAPDSARLAVIGGTQSMIEHARRRAQHRGVTDRIIFAGAQRDVVPFLHAADAVVLASAYEANALVLLEALATGVPVIATPVGIAVDVIQTGSTGYLVTAEAASIGEAISKLHAGDRENQRRASRQVALRHSWSSAAGEYLRLADAIRTARKREDARAEGSDDR